uniref:Uncharacterized protein n=1 Tax=Myoviridae sp. ct2AC8 TaxID=2827655 RepID=A0A8S5TQ04_9CAUD|nr:MAG TPA: hypothetical protein [Myoviridae sp. ct2AC8]
MNKGRGAPTPRRQNSRFCQRKPRAGWLPAL